MLDNKVSFAVLFQNSIDNPPPFVLDYIRFQQKVGKPLQVAFFVSIFVVIKMQKFILSIFLLLISTYSFATEVKYVGVNSASIREYATDSTPIIGKIPYGKKVYVHDTLNGWSRLTDVKETKQRWVSSTELCNSPNCNLKHNTTANQSKKTLVQAPKANKIKKSVSANKSVKVAKKRKPYYSSGCACGYGYCYGPRGGRYCITSGGNKNYR